MSHRSIRKIQSAPFQFAAFELDTTLAKARKVLIKRRKAALRIDAQLEVQIKSLREYYQEELTTSKYGPDIVKLFSLFSIDSNPRAKCEPAVVERLEEWKSEVANTEWHANYTKLKTKERKVLNQLRATESRLDELKRLLHAYKAIGGLASSLKDKSPRTRPQNDSNSHQSRNTHSPPTKLTRS